MLAVHGNYISTPKPSATMGLKKCVDSVSVFIGAKIQIFSNKPSFFGYFSIKKQCAKTEKHRRDSPSLFDVREKIGCGTKKREEGSQLENVLDAGQVGKPPEQG